MISNELFVKYLSRSFEHPVLFSYSYFTKSFKSFTFLEGILKSFKNLSHIKTACPFFNFSIILVFPSISLSKKYLAVGISLNSIICFLTQVKPTELFINIESIGPSKIEKSLDISTVKIPNSIDILFRLSSSSSVTLKGNFNLS